MLSMLLKHGFLANFKWNFTTSYSSLNLGNINDKYYLNYYKQIFIDIQYVT
jgi:hypothetical protein